uniref:Uncharacterized LOC107575641 n=1 Tax=Sinocyclocheilus grahami TaxID=75366 RepID=A0A672LH90_SINGR
MCRYEDNLSLLCRCVESLLRRGANPNRIVGDGVSAVHLAAGKESEKGLRCLKLILQHGADPNLRTTENLTPLHIAASWGCFQNLRFLLRNGGNPNLTDQVKHSLETSVSEAGNKVTTPECLTGMQEVKKTAKGMPQIIPTAVGDKESSVTCGLASQGSLPFQVDNSESASSLMYESPKAQKNPGANPGCSGCTPRYSMSRLSGRSRQALANLSCTPAGQPLTTDTDVPVEYLYTDTEEGHKSIISFSVAGYSPELENGLHRFVLPNCQADELALCEQFDKPDQNKRWREGFIKSSFNYLLLDPRVTKNLPYRSQSMNPKECFQTFISAVFYVGKGKRSRPYSHLYEALEYFKGDKTSKVRLQHILQVWNAGHGVISLHCFQNVIAVEAYTREACMVDAIGLKMLTNQKRGDYYGVVSTWPVRRKRELGVHLLYRAMQIFL